MVEKGKLDTDGRVTQIRGVGRGLEGIGKEGELIFTQESEVMSCAILCGLEKSI